MNRKFVKVTAIVLAAIMVASVAYILIAFVAAKVNSGTASILPNLLAEGERAAVTFFAA